MNEPSRFPFGIIIAYLLPGFIGLVGVASVFPAVSEWLRPVNQGDTGVGPAVYTVLAAMAVGMIASCVRWLALDHLHELTGVVPPIWDDSALDKNLAAFNYLVEAHYRYYQFYGNALVAIIWAFSLNLISRTYPVRGFGTDVAVISLCAILFAGSRDALAKYYTRTSRLIGVIAEKDIAGHSMTNGNHHDQEAGAKSQAGSGDKSQHRPTAAPPSKPVVKSEQPQK